MNRRTTRIRSYAPVTIGRSKTYNNQSCEAGTEGPANICFNRALLSRILGDYNLDRCTDGLLVELLYMFIKEKDNRIYDYVNLCLAEDLESEALYIYSISLEVLGIDYFNVQTRISESRSHIAHIEDVDDLFSGIVSREELVKATLEVAEPGDYMYKYEPVVSYVSFYENIEDAETIVFCEQLDRMITVNPMLMVCNDSSDGFVRVIGKKERKIRRDTRSFYDDFQSKTRIRSLEQSTLAREEREACLSNTHDTLCKKNVELYGVPDGCSWDKKKQATNDKEEKEDKWYCRATTFYKVPNCNEYALQRAQGLFPRFCKGPFDMPVLKEAFRGVNEVLYELNWFVKLESVSFDKSRKYLNAFMHNGKQLTNLKASKITENFRENDAMVYWFANYKLFLKMFCRRENNNFTKRYDDYLKHSKTGRLDFTPVPPQGHYVRGKFKGVRTKSYLGENRNGVPYKKDFEPEAQMFGSMAARWFKSTVTENSADISDGIWEVISQVLKEIPSKLANLVTTAFTGIKHTVTVIMDFLKEMFDKLKETFQEILEVLSGISLNTAMICAFVVLVGLLILWYNRSQFSSITHVFSISLCRTLELIGCDITKEDAITIDDIFTVAYEAQSWTSLVPILGLGLGVGLSLTDKVASQSAGAAINFAARLPTVANSLEEALKECFDWIYYQYYGTHWLKDKAVVNEFEEFLKMFAKFHEETNVEKRIVEDIDYALVLEKLNEKKKILEPMVRGMKLLPGLSAALLKAFSRVEVLSKFAQSNADLYKTRIETICLWLYGKPGQGKTTCIEYIVASVYENMSLLYPELFPGKFSRGMMHQRVKNSDYWEGYSRQFCAVWNEVLEKDNALERSKVCSELLNAFEDGIFPLNMAFDKGSAYFASYLGVLTSNITDPELRKCGMTSPSAIVRRRTLHCEVVRGAVFDKEKGNFDEAWEFLLHFPRDSDFQEAFLQGSPEDIGPLVKKYGSVKLVFSDVVRIICVEMEKRIKKRQTTTELVRNFDFVAYQNRNKFIEEEKPKVDHEQMRENEREILMKEFENEYMKIWQDERRDLKEKVKETVFEPEAQMYFAGQVAGYITNKFDSARKYIKKDKHAGQRIDSHWRACPPKYFVDAMFQNNTNNGLTVALAKMSEEIRKETIDAISEACEYKYRAIFVQLIKWAMTPDSSVRYRTVKLLKYCCMLRYQNMFVRDYAKKKMKGLGFDSNSIRMFVEVLNSQIDFQKLVDFMRQGEITGAFVNCMCGIVPDNIDVWLKHDLFKHWAAVSNKHTLDMLYDKTKGASELIIKGFKHHFANIEDKNEENWRLFGTRIVARWGCFMEETFTPFMYKYSTILFGSLGCLVAGCLAAYFLSPKDSEPINVTELEARFPQQEVPQSMSRGNNPRMNPREVVPQVNLVPNQKMVLSPKEVQKQSNERDVVPRMGPREVLVQSPVRDVIPKLGPRDIQVQSAKNEQLSVAMRWADLNFVDKAWIMFLVSNSGAAILDIEDTFLNFIEKYVVSDRLLVTEFFNLLKVTCLNGKYYCLDLALVLFGVEDRGIVGNEVNNDRVRNYWKYSRATKVEASEGMSPMERSLVKFIDEMEAQSGVEDQVGAISLHMRLLKVVYPEGEYYTKGILSGSRFITTSHFFLEYGYNFESLHFVNGDKIMMTAFPHSVRVNSLEGRRDLVSIDFKPGYAIAPYRSISNKMYDDVDAMVADMNEVGDYSRLSRTIMPNGEVLIHRQSQKNVFKGVNPITMLRIAGKRTKVDHQLYYIMINGFGNPGDCGEPYVSVDPTNVVRLVGLHTGRNGNDSIFAPLFKSDFADQAIFAQCYIPKYMKNMKATLHSGPVYNGKYMYEGKAPKTKIIPKKTRLVASPAQGSLSREALYPVNTAPALLAPEDTDKGPVYPLDNAMKKLGASPPRGMPKWIEQMGLYQPDNLFSGFFPDGMNMRSLRQWTIEEALFGIPGVWPGLARDTAIGYDMEICLPNCKSRKEIWDPETKYISPVLRQLVQDLDDAVKRGELPKNVVAACLKDETRDLGRVAEGKTRLFCVGALSHLVWTVMHMGALVIEMKNHKGSSDVAIGTNIHDFDWKFIYAKVLDDPSFVFGGGDYSNYDTSINVWFGWLMGRACVAKYGYKPGTFQYLAVIACCMSSMAPLMVCISDVYWFDYMNPSGAWLTGFLNSFVGVVILNCFVIWAQAHSDDPVFKNAKLKEIMKRMVYGDDNIWAWFKKFQKEVSMQKIGDFIYKFFGMTYTTPDKKEITEDFIDREDLSFLCRKFVFEGGLVRAPLDEDSIYSMVNWIRKPRDGKTEMEQYLINVEQACQEWFHYGRERFELETEKLRSHCREIAVEYPGHSYQDYYERWLFGQVSK